MRRRAIVAGLTAALAVTTYATASAVAVNASLTGRQNHATTPPSSIGPDKTAWYDGSRPTAAAPPTPMVGVGPKDLVVSGITVNTALLPLSVPIPPVREVADFVALSFALPHGASPASLTLQLTGTTTAALDNHLPSGVTPVACPVTSPFKSGLQQPADEAPTYDCSKRSTVGQLGAGGKTVTFPGISRLLLSGRRLSVVILPGSLGPERLVFSTPTSTTLSLLSFGSTAPLATPAITPPPVVHPNPPGQAGPSGIPPIPPAQVATMPVPAASRPAIAPATTAGLATAALSKPDDRRERAAALAMLAALVAAVGWLVVTERGGRARGDELGVGRFRSFRNGPTPTI